MRETNGWRSFEEIVGKISFVVSLSHVHWFVVFFFCRTEKKMWCYFLKKIESTIFYGGNLCAHLSTVARQLNVETRGTSATPPPIPSLPPYFFTRAACNPPHDVLGIDGGEFKWGDSSVGSTKWGWGEEKKYGVGEGVPKRRWGAPTGPHGRWFFLLRGKLQEPAGTTDRFWPPAPTFFFFNDASALGIGTCPEDEGRWGGRHIFFGTRLEEFFLFFFIFKVSP